MVKNLLVACLALVSSVSVAGLVQPLVPAGEEAPVRISGGVVSGISGTKDGFGVRNAGVGIGFTHDVGYFFEYGLSLAGNWASHNSKIFTDAGKDSSGTRLDVELMTRYMPELTERLYAGLVISLGWGQQFGENAKVLNDQRAFGDMNFKVGPALSYGFTDMFAGYFGVNYSLHNIRFGAKDNTAAKTSANQMGLDIPVGLWVGIADSAGLFLEANSRFTDFSNFGKSFKEEVTLGVGFAI